MATTRAIGVVAEKRNDSARIRVLAFERGQSWVYSQAEIDQAFPPSGYVFGPSFYKKHKAYKEDSCVEFSFEENDWETRADYDRYIVNGMVREGAMSVIHINWPILDAWGCIHQTNLQRLLNDVDLIKTTAFYLQSNNQIYGPFALQYEAKQISGISAKNNKNVRRWSARDLIVVSFENSCYLIEEPAGETQIIDCLPDKDLCRWAVKQLAAINTLPDLKEHKPLIEEHFCEQYESPLHQIRMNKFLALFDTLAATQDTIASLASIAQPYQVAYQRALEDCRAEILAQKESELAAYLEEQQAAVTRQIAELQQRKASATSDTLQAEQALSQISTQLSQVEQDVRHLKDERERLLQDLRIHAQVIIRPSTLSSVSSPRPTYSLNTYRGSTSSAMCWEVFAKCFGAYLDESNLLTHDDMVAEILAAFQQYRLLLVGGESIVLALAAASGNADCFLQQAEPDWLTYRAFEERILETVLDHCSAHPDRFTFLLLQRVNLASPACYAQPLFDVHAGLRQCFPNRLEGWPNNLWVFATVASTGPDGMGLPLQAETWRQCGATKPSYGRRSGFIQWAPACGQLPVTAVNPWQPSANSAQALKDYLHV